MMKKCFSIKKTFFFNAEKAESRYEFYGWYRRENIQTFIFQNIDTAKHIKYASKFEFDAGASSGLENSGGNIWRNIS